ncbi:hypothetical protein DRJ23_02950 [Candidatus Acetothermia bacterium]|nr:MAG: hypothetical protein DRJ23_02950 [Candidatus Acetothermia bacterium]
MKGLVAVVGLVLLAGMGAYAGDLEMFAGAGPGGAALGEINAAITLYNTIIAALNETPTIDGTVPLIPHLGAGIGYYAGEQFWMTDSLAIGGKLEYFRTETSTSGSYTSGDETSQIAVDLGCSFVGFVLTGRFDFLSSGLTIGVTGGVGYYYSGFTTAITFQMPSGYPPISVHPHEGEGHYNNQAVGFEAGLSITYPMTDWLGIGAELGYRALTSPTITDADGTGLDLDGDGTAEQIDLSGISIQFRISLAIDLSI